ncbi:MAG TPA: EAL domain-containing protein [Actinomycetes bacterium]|nr:EAL domain-containing protein [Actinomycetes bacterium]
MATRLSGARSVAGRVASSRPLIVVALAVAVGAGLGWSVASLRDRADDHWQHVEAIGRAQALADREVAAGWECAATLTPTCRAQLSDQADGLDQEVARLARAGVHGVAAPLRQHDRAAAAARAQLSAPRASTRIAAAKVLAAEEPSLSDALDHVALVERGRAHTDSRLADLESLLIVLLAAAVVVALSRRQSAVRAASEVAAAEERARGEARFRSLVTNSSDVVTLTDADGVIRFQTPSVRRVLGYDPEDAIGRHALESCHRDDHDVVRSALARTLAGEDHVVSVTRWRHADGSWRWLESVRTNLLADPDVQAIVVNSRDVTEQRRLADQLEHSALHDALTGLPNRALFVDRVAQSLRKGLHPAVLFVDLDDFKAVNERIGHVAGDAVLREVADRLAVGAGPGDTIARTGADHFAVMLEDVADAGRAEEAGGRILAALSAPVTVSGHTVVPESSIGVAVADEDVPDADELLSRADLALSEAKAAGKRQVVCYAHTMRAAVLGAVDARTRLSQALRHSEMVVHYQPMVELSTGLVVGVEALLRWYDPVRGVVPPEEFIPLVESSPTIVELGRFAMTTACRQLAAWRRAAVVGPRFTVSVNVAARQIEATDFVDEVARCLRENGLPPENLTLEVTEGQLVRDVDASASTLMRLRSLGVRVAIDDFGTGYSSLSYLERLPVNLLKIDRSFVSGGTDSADHDGSVLLRGIVELGLALGLQVVAEGVETEEQRETLRGLGCVLGQGFLFAGALPAEEVSTVLAHPLAAEPA